MRRRTAFVFVALLLCLSLVLLAGCVPPPPPVAAAGPSAPEKVIVRQAVDGSVFADLNPFTACWGEYFVLGNLYETLTKYNPPSVEPFIAPGLAREWSRAADGLSWTFHLQPGVKFHDGTAVDAEAVRFSILRHKELGCAGYLYAPIERIETPDALTVVFYLTSPVPLDIVLASGYSAWIVSPASATDKDANWFAAGNEAGSGPYRISRYEPGQRMVIERFDDYRRGWSAGQIDSVIFELVEDPAAVEQMLRAGQLDLASSRSLGQEQMASLDAEERLVLDVSPGSLNSVLYLNQRRVPLDNPLVRQALAYSYPYDEVIANSNLGKGTRARGAVPVSVWGHNPGEAAYAYDPEKAAALFAQAGYGNGLEIEFSFDPTELPAAELWRAALAEIGVDLKLIPIDFGTRADTVRNDPENAAHINSIFWGPDALGPYTYLFNMFHSEEAPLFNLGYYSNPAFDALIDEANLLSGTDPDAAAALFAESQRILDEDAAGIFVQDFPNLIILDESLQGFVGNPGYNNAVFWYDIRR